jgi:hypothetical protein
MSKNGMGFKSIEIEGIRMRRIEGNSSLRCLCGVANIRPLMAQLVEIGSFRALSGWEHITRLSDLNASFYFLIKFDNRRYA